MTPFLKLYTFLKDKLNVKYGNYVRKEYIPQIKQIISPNTSIISNNCFGGRISQDLGYPYNSPTAGLYFYYPDYILFLENLEEAINAPIRFIEKSQHELDWLRQAQKQHVIGFIDIGRGGGRDPLSSL